MVRDVILPKLGQTMEEGVIVEWLKQEGDPVKRGDVLFTTESDKATLEVESPARGFLRKILVPAGETIPVLTVVGLIARTWDEDVSGYEGGRDKGTRDKETRRQGDEGQEVGGRIFASPRARKVARERGVDLGLVSGSGPNGRIVERDVMGYLEAAPKVTPVARRLAEHEGVDLRAVSGTGSGGRITRDDVARAMVSPAPTVVAKAAPAVAETPMSGVRAVIARRMHEGHTSTASSVRYSG